MSIDRQNLDDQESQLVLRDHSRSPELAEMSEKDFEEALHWLETNPEQLENQELNIGAELKRLKEHSSEQFKSLLSLYLRKKMFQDKSFREAVEVVCAKRFRSVSIFDERFRVMALHYLLSGQEVHNFGGEFLEDRNNVKTLIVFCTLFLGLPIAGGCVLDKNYSLAMALLCFSMLANALVFKVGQRKLYQKYVGSKEKEIPLEVEAWYKLAEHVVKLKKLEEDYSASLDPTKNQQAAIFTASAMVYLKKMEDFGKVFDQIFAEAAIDNELKQKKLNPHAVKLENVDAEVALLEIPVLQRRTRVTALKGVSAQKPVDSEALQAANDNIADEEKKLTMKV